MKSFICGVILLSVSTVKIFSFVERQKKDNLSLKEGDVRMEHLVSNFPTLKNVRDGLLHQYQETEKDLRKLYDLHDKVDGDSSKKMITGKLQSLYQEKERLKQQIRNLDAEVERGVILKSFDNIEAGGIKKIVKQEIDQEYVKDLSRASRVNNALEYYLK